MKRWVQLILLLLAALTAFGSNGLFSPFAPEEAYNAYGGAIERLDQRLPIFYGGSGQSAAYQVTYGTLSAATVFIGTEFGQAGRVAHVGRTASRPQLLLPAGRQPVALLPEAAESLAARGLATGPDEAVFWSGIGKGGAERAANWAAQHGGVTLESTLTSRGITIPAWDASNPAVVAAWRQASMEFAAGARGNVRVLQGDALRIDAIWRDEFRALQANPNVVSIRAINPETGAEVLLWTR